MRKVAAVSPASVVSVVSVALGVTVAPVALVACGSAPPPASPVAEVAAPPLEAASPPVDAAPPVPIDAGPPPELLTAPAWIFRYDVPPRVETWTLRHHGGQALVVVEGPQGTTRYLGTATDGASLVLDVTGPAATMRLDCKPARRPVAATCGERKPAPLDVLDCYHPDFAAPMTFARAPGVTFDAACNAYRRLP